MGANFNYVPVPKKIQKHDELQRFYERTKEKIYRKYGDDFEGYTGDLASDDDTLEIKGELALELPKHKIIRQNRLDYDEEMKICELIEGHAEKFGPSVAVRVNQQWVICGLYSD